MVTSAFACVEDRYPSGDSFYRALARQIYGNPDHVDYIRAAVHDHFLGLWTRSQQIPRPNVWENGYQRYIHDFEGFAKTDPWAKDYCAKSFVGGLQCPDLVLCGCAPTHARLEMAASFLAVISAALRVKIELRWADHEAWTAGGYGFNRTCRVEYRVDSSIDFRCKHAACSMIEDQSGSALIEMMHDEKNLNLDILPVREISWWLNDPEKFEKTDPMYHDFTCYNEWREGLVAKARPEPTDPAHLKGLSVYTICVNKPEQMRPALNLLFRALELAPSTREPIGTPFNRGAVENPALLHSERLKKYVGVDAEFTKRGLTTSEREAEFKKYNEGPKADWTFNFPPYQKAVDNGATEELASVLTIAVDRHVVFSFFLLDMLENPESGTVEAISTLFGRVIFNPDLIKMWFRYSSDIKVLDATIAHLYQGTPRTPYHAIKQYPNDILGPVIPTFKIKSQFYNGERPMELEFSHDTNVQCELHLNSDVNDQGIACPCKFGNIDIVTLIDYICHELGRERYPKSPWWGKNVSRLSYARLLAIGLGSHDIYPLLNQFKDAPGCYSSEDKEEMMEPRTAFFNTLRWGMQENDRAMGYNIGDVIGLALITRMLRESDDRRLLTNVFYSSSMAYYGQVTPVTGLERPETERRRKFSTVKPGNAARPLIDDFPKIYYREKVGKFNTGASLGRDAITIFRLVEPSVPDWTLSYLEHDERTLERRTAAIKIASQTNPTVAVFNRAREGTFTEEVRRAAHTSVWDPTKFCWPQILTTPIINTNNAPKVDYFVDHPDRLRGEVVNGMIFGARLRIEAQLKARPAGYRGPLPPFPGPAGFLQLACPEGALHWMWPEPNNSIPPAGQTFNNIEVAATAVDYGTLRFQPFFINESFTKRINHLDWLNEKSPLKLPRRPDGEHVNFAPRLFNDPNRVAGVEGDESESLTHLASDLQNIQVSQPADPTAPGPNPQPQNHSFWRRTNRLSAWLPNTPQAQSIILDPRNHLLRLPPLPVPNYDLLRDGEAGIATAKKPGQKRKASEMDSSDEHPAREAGDEGISDDERAKEDSDYEPHSESDAEMDIASDAEVEMPPTPPADMHTTSNSNPTREISSSTRSKIHDWTKPMSEAEAESITGDWELSDSSVVHADPQKQGLPAPLYQVDLSAPSNYPLMNREPLLLSDLRFGDDWERRMIEKIEAEGRTWYKLEELQESMDRAIAARKAREEQWNREGLERMSFLDQGVWPYDGESEEER